MSATSPPVVRLARTASTMDALHALAQGGAPTGTAVVAAEQEAGRGSRGRRWSSPVGGLWLSVLARPAAEGVELLSLRAGLAVVAVLERHGLRGRVRLKWPNDLMLDDRKTGGLLCEARWQGPALAWVAIGLGLNVTNPPPPELAALATHLGAASAGWTVEALVGPVLAALRGIDPAAGPLTPTELAAFAEHDWLRNRSLDAPVAGVAAGLGEDGALRVRRPDGTIAAVRAGTVAVAATSART